MAAKPDCAVCYVADFNFLLPSILSAIQLRRYVSASTAEIFIFSVEVDTAVIDDANRDLQKYDVQIIPIPDSSFASIDKKRLATTNTTLATFGRFFMEAALPERSKRIVYLDGDVWATRDPIQLIETTVPVGRFAAADDAIFFRQRVRVGYVARQIHTYFSNLGLDLRNGYFNAGVFATSRSTWQQIADEAYRYFISNQDVCERFDQSALNAVVGDRRLRLSSKWNFQTQFKIWNLDRIVKPNICHFNLYPKPWDGVMFPWQEMNSVYEAAIDQFGPTDLPIGSCTAETIAEHNRKAKKDYSYLQIPLASTLALSAMGFAKIEREAWM